MPSPTDPWRRTLGCAASIRDQIRHECLHLCARPALPQHGTLVPSRVCCSADDEDPDKMYVTCRGQHGALALFWKLPCFKASPGAGLTVLDVSDPLQPAVLERWDSPNRLEGQDRRGSLLVVTQIYDGWLYTFDADSVAAGPRGRCKLHVDRALHVRLHTDAGRRRRTSRHVVVPFW